MLKHPYKSNHILKRRVDNEANSESFYKYYNYLIQSTQILKHVTGKNRNYIV